MRSGAHHGDGPAWFPSASSDSGETMLEERFEAESALDGDLVVPLAVRRPLVALPTAPTSLFGRDDDVAAVLSLIQQEQVRLLTLTGPGGVGKTRLAIRVAHEVVTALGGGARFVDLSGVQRAEQVPMAVIQACDVQEDSRRPVLETLIDALRGRKLLLVLDNVEQVVAAAPDVASILSALPELTILATSRVALRVRAEFEYGVAPLPTPALSENGQLEHIARNPAVALFADRARAVDPSFALTEQNSPDIAAICGRLDGLPLAVELAAARISLMGPRALLQRLDRRLPMLTGGPRDLPARQRTLQDSIAWSYELLAPEHQESFRRLSVFAGGCSFESVVAVSQPVPEAESGQDFVDSDQQAFAAVTALVEANILRRDDTEDYNTRYQMLETIREFGFGQLIAQGEEPGVRRVHARLMVAIAEEAEDALVGPEQRRWYQRLDAEHENLRAALQWCISASEAELAQRLAAALWRYWAVRGFLLEARSWLEQALSMPGAPAVAPLVHAKALHRQGNVAIDLGDYVAARRRCEESLAICQSLDDSGGIASTLNGLGLVAAFEGDYVSAATFHSAALERRRALDDLLGLGNSLTNLGNALHAQGDVTGAERLLREALQVRQAMGDSGSVAYAYLNIAELAHGRGDQAEALELFEKSLSLFQQIGDQLGVAYALHILGVVHGDLGDGAKAMPLHRESLGLRREMGDRRGQIECVEGIASLLAIGPDTARHQAAIQLTSAATALRETIGAPRPPSEQASHRRLVDTMQAAMATGEFRKAWNQGERMTLAETVERAESVAAGYTPPSKAVPALEGLTGREIDVLRLVSRGLTNREIADQLFLSPRTVHSHIYTIFRKLDVSSRSAATRVALDNDIT